MSSDTAIAHKVFRLEGTIVYVLFIVKVSNSKYELRGGFGNDGPNGAKGSSRIITTATKLTQAKRLLKSYYQNTSQIPELALYLLISRLVYPSTSDAVF